MNLIFTNPLFLFASALALIPLVIHLIYKKRVTRILFSSLIFIEKTHLQSAKRFRLRELLLLAVRMALILSLVLAVSQPVLKLEGKGGAFFSAGAKTEKLVMVIDNSASMGYYDNAVTVLEESVQKAKEILRLAFETGDDIAVIPSADIQNHVYSEVHTLEQAEELLDQIRLSYSSESVVDAIKLAEAAYERNPDVQARIFIFSDFQKSSFSNVIYTQPEKRDWELIFVDMNKREFFNIAVEDIRKPAIFYNTRSPAKFGVSVRNYGNLPGDAIVEMFLNGKKVSQQSLPALRNQPRSLEAVVNPEKANVLLGRILVDGDNLKADNSTFFLDEVTGNIRIAIVDGLGSSVYLRKALDAYEYKSVVQYDLVSPNRFGQEILSYDLIFLSSFQGMGELQVGWIEKFLDQGKSLFLVMENSLDIVSFNRLFASSRILPLRVLNKTIRSAEDTSSDRISQQDFSHPLVSFFRDYDFFPLVKFTGYYKTELDLTDPGLQVLSSFGNGTPLLVEYEKLLERGRRGRILVFTSDMSGDLNTIVGHPNYPVFIFQSIKYLTGKNYPDFKPGTHETTVRNSLGLVRSGNLEIYDPLKNSFSTYLPEYLERPGIYRLQQEYFTVNMPKSESDLTPSNKDDLKKTFGEFRSIEEKADVRSQLAVLGGGIPLAYFFLFLAIILLLCEMFLANNILPNKDKSSITS